MPKQKTKKSITKRFKITKKGKILRLQSFARHLKAKKSRKRIRKLKKSKELKGFYAKKLRKVLGIKVRKKHGKS